MQKNIVMMYGCLTAKLLVTLLIRKLKYLCEGSMKAWVGLNEIESLTASQTQTMTQLCCQSYITTLTYNKFNGQCDYGSPKDTVQSHPVRTAAVRVRVRLCWWTDCSAQSYYVDHSTNPSTSECKLAVTWDTHAYVHIHTLRQSCQHWHQIPLKLVHFSSSWDTVTQKNCF
jgi:hypothetical protein